MTASLQHLPVELLYRIFLLANSPALPLVCRSLWIVFRQAPPSVSAQYLPSCLKDALNYPVMDQRVLEQYCRLHPPFLHPAVSLPYRLFRKMAQPTAKQLRSQLPDHYHEESEPIPFLNALLKFFPNQVDIQFPVGYPLLCAVRAGHVPLIRWFLKAGADPLISRRSIRDSPLFLAIKTRSLNLVRLLIEEGESPSLRGLPPELLKGAYEQKAFDIVFYLVEEKGMVPTVEILQWVADHERPSGLVRKRRRLDSSNRSRPSH